MTGHNKRIAVSRRTKAPEGSSIISVKLTSLDQLITSKHQIFPGSNLDPLVAQYIYNEADAAPLDEPFRVHVVMPRYVMQPQFQEQISEVFRTHAIYQATLAKRELRRTYQRGRRSIVKATVVVICLAVFAYLTYLLSLPANLERFIAGLFIVIAWITCWTPVETYLYRWWPSARQARVYENLAHATVEIIAAEKD